MKGKKIISALQHVDPALIEEAASAPTAATRGSGFRFSTLIAACLCLVCCMAAFGFLLKDKLGVPIASEDPTFIDATTGNAEEHLTTPSDTAGEYVGSSETPFRIAVIAEGLYEGRNASAYEACGQWCEAHGTERSYYSIENETTEARVRTIERAIKEGYNVLLFANKGFAEAIAQTADLYPDVYFVALDLSTSDFGEDYVAPPNVLCVSFQEEISGFMAGVAAVKLGYRKFGFLGNPNDSGVTRCGYGFVQGLDYGAGLLGVDVEMKYCYGDYTEAYDAVYERMGTWFAGGTEVLFACGGEPNYAVIGAAAEAGGKMIGNEISLDPMLNSLYEEGLMLTSAEKNIERAIEVVLDAICAGDGQNHGQNFYRFGLESSENLEDNYVTLSDYTQFGENFTRADYEALISDLINGTIVVSDDIENKPVTDHVVVEYQDDIHG